LTLTACGSGTSLMPQCAPAFLGRGNAACLRYAGGIRTCPSVFIENTGLRHKEQRRMANPVTPTTGSP
ncbi:MAG: hypothetical protein JXB33_08910, partial [Clostridia bacterium]|nr:hypothetical protein [Clostridia bacterium]